MKIKSDEYYISPFFCALFLLLPENLQHKETKKFYFVHSQLTSPKQPCKNYINTIQLLEKIFFYQNNIFFQCLGEVS